MGAIIDTLNKRKVELKSEQVDLATAKELVDLNERLKTSIDKAPSIVNKIDKAKSDLFSLISNSEKIMKEATKAKAEITKQVKSLGISPKEVPAIKSIDETMKFTQNAVKKFKEQL